MKHICVVGGGISGLGCAHTLTRLAATSGRNVKVSLFESNSHLGGQINTKTMYAGCSRAVIEAGAEGFVARSRIFPSLATSCGISQDDIVSQMRIADNELRRGHGTKWNIEPLAPGVAAQKLGFQVAREDRGKGIRSFRSGMGQLVHALGESLHDIRCDARVSRIEPSESGDRVSLEYDQGGPMEALADAVVLAIPWSGITSITQITPGPVVDHHSHVSVHILVKKDDNARPTSFSVPLELQSQFNGLRAVSFMNEKFPGRCDDDHWLFRFYFRPPTHSQTEDGQLWLGIARQALEEIFGIKGTSAHHISSWKESLPVFGVGHIDRTRDYQSKLDEIFSGRVVIAGSEAYGAGLDVAATSGVDAANRIMSLLE